MAEYPYLTINEEVQLEWVLGYNGPTKGVHIPKIIEKKAIGTQTNEIVSKFIRYNRNYYSIWTNFANIYEYGPDGLVKIKLKTIIPPTYYNGWYIGYAKHQPSNHITFVHRTKPDKCIGVNFTGKDVKSIHKIPWTNYIIINTEKGAYRYSCDMYPMTHHDWGEGSHSPDIKDRKKLAASFDLFAIDSDAAVIALNHVDGKTTIIWTSSWKTHHTLRSPKLIDMKLNKKYLIGINKSNMIYLWDLASGDVETVVNSPWHKPEYIFFSGLDNDTEIATLDVSNKVIALWSLGKDTTLVPWPTFEISPSVTLISTMSVEYIINAASYWNDKLILNADGYTVKIDLNINNEMFAWPCKIVTWIDNPVDEMYLEPLLDKDDDIYDVVKKNILNNMDTVVNNILEYVQYGEKAHPWCFQKLLKDKDIGEHFHNTFVKIIKNMYEDNAFQETEITLNVALYIRTMNINLIELFNELPQPITKSDFIFWTYMVKMLNLKTEQKIAEKEGFIEAVWTVFDLSDDPEVKFCARNLLFILRMYIKCWGLVLKDKRIFEFITFRQVKKSCIEGWANEWLDVFIKCRDNTTHNENIQLCWKELVSYLLSRDVLRSYNYPNSNDGKWISKPLDEVNTNDWVLIDDLVRKFNDKIPESPDEPIKEILVWVKNKEGRKDSIERALTIMDKDLWINNTDWRENICELLNLERGWEVHILDSNIKGYVYNWPCICCQGTNEFVDIDPKSTIRYRIPTMRYSIPDRMVIETEYFIKNLILNDKLPPVPDSFKSVLFDCLRPDPIQNLQSVDIMIEVTCMVSDRQGSLWIGTHSGIVCKISLSELTLNSDERDVMEMISGHIGPINSIDCKYSKIVSADDSAMVKIWDTITNTCLCTIQMDLTSVKSVRFVDISTIWILSNNGCLWSYNFESCSKPDIITNLRNNESILNHYSMDIIDGYCIAVSKRLTHWFCDYPYSLNKIDRTEDRISSVKNLTTTEYVYGTMSGKVILGATSNTVQDNELIWQSDEESITALNIIPDGSNWVVLIGCESGKVLFKYLDLPNKPNIFEWKASNSIISLVYEEPRVIIACSDYSIYTLLFRNKQIQHASECLVKLSSKKEWQTFIKRRPEQIQRIISAGVNNNICMDEFSEVISVCIEDFNERAKWCTKTVKNILMSGMKHKPKIFEPLIDKLFCFSGKKFTCVLCLGSTTSPKRWPVSLLTTCLHRFHSKCIKQHVDKIHEWDDECQQNWALTVKLSCPICREPFTRKHIVEDKFTAEICKYESSSDEET